MLEKEKEIDIIIDGNDANLAHSFFLCPTMIQE